MKEYLLTNFLEVRYSDELAEMGSWTAWWAPAGIYVGCPSRLIGIGRSELPKSFRPNSRRIKG